MCDIPNSSYLAKRFTEKFSLKIFVHVTCCAETMAMSRIVKKTCSIFKTKQSTELKTGQQIYVQKWLLPDKGKSLKFLILFFSDVT